MADNVPITPGVGIIVATDDVGGVQYQLVKLVVGADGVASMVGGDVTNGIDVDVTRIIPGVTATALGKAEDAVHASGDTGVMSLGVRQDTAAALAATGDYAPFTLDLLNRLRVNTQDVRFADSVTNLAANATFTGTGRDLGATNSDYDSLRAFAFADVAGTLYIEVSDDNVTWRTIKTQAVAANTR